MAKLLRRAVAQNGNGDRYSFGRRFESLILPDPVFDPVFPFSTGGNLI
jgi:hypothetical protein